MSHWFILGCWIFLRIQGSNLYSPHKLKIYNYLSYSNVQNSRFINPCTKMSMWASSKSIRKSTWLISYAIKAGVQFFENPPN